MKKKTNLQKALEIIQNCGRVVSTKEWADLMGCDHMTMSSIASDLRAKSINPKIKREFKDGVCYFYYGEKPKVDLGWSTK